MFYPRFKSYGISPKTADQSNYPEASYSSSGAMPAQHVQPFTPTPLQDILDGKGQHNQPIYQLNPTTAGNE
ncbi:MAG: hypothetical protein R3261_07675, partial [Alphaproteobacteria bacterium]|nr:hypothetical protein [Alphaproteobacteria bacterium]